MLLALKFGHQNETGAVIFRTGYIDIAVVQNFIY